ncbi:MAG TPA: ABC transporter ATP-binding protein [Stellaceae bacterium]|jgi:branched-chain amino acid transport system ATP-binding protein|nr:ABC transporter ATP-binding protein [Stellaceae bacterium]
MSLLETRGLVAAYGDFQALYGIDLRLAEGEMVGIIGANGAGKTTLLRAITGLLRAAPERIRFAGEAIGSLAPSRIVRLGIAMVPEGRRLFPSLTVEENLCMGTQPGRAGPWTLQRVYELFPILAERRRAAATALSGGQQQMAAIGRALMTNPRLLLCDEISLGLAPIVIRDIYHALPAIRAEGTTVLLVEQDTNRALAVADRVYCLQEGRVTLEGPPGQLTREQIRHAYFGM